MNNDEANKMSEKDKQITEMSKEEAFQYRLEMAKRIMEEHKSLFERLSKL